MFILATPTSSPAYPFSSGNAKEALGSSLVTGLHSVSTLCLQAHLRRGGGGEGAGGEGEGGEGAQ